MLRYFILVGMLLSSIPCTLLAQNQVQLQGQLTNATGEPLQSATIVLFQLADSSFADYTLSDAEGRFQLKGKPATTYELQISYLGYTPLLQPIDLQKDTTLPVLVLTESSTTLEVAQVEADHIPIRMNGDTLEFNSGAFDVETHDDLEALLRQLPGVEIDEEGKVLVNGRRVEKITIDGKEFFGENVRIALKNLPADAIEKIQSFDKKTDKEELLGKKAKGDTKVLNLVLKEDKKKGTTGHVRGGYGYNPSLEEHQYEGKVNLHHFNPTMRFSVIGALNNINEAGMTYSEYSSLSGGYMRDFMNNRALHLANANSLPVLNMIVGSATGLYTMGNTGIEASFFPSKKTDVNINYLYSNVRQRLLTDQYNRSILEESFFTQQGQITKLPIEQLHGISAKLKQTIDSTQELRVNVRFRHAPAEEIEQQRTELLENDLEINSLLEQEQRSRSWDNNFASSLYYQKKFKKKGRAFWVNGALIHRDVLKNWDLLGTTRLFENGQALGIDSLSQTQRLTHNNQLYGLKVAYVEPLGERWDWEGHVVAGWHNEQKNQQTSDLVDGQPITNNLLSDQFDKAYDYQQFMSTFEGSSKEEKWTYSLGAGVQRSQLSGVLQSSDAVVQQQYFFPVIQLNATTTTKKGGSVRINYNTEVREPTIEQLQPLLNNQNPLFLRLGNPNLVPAFNHALDLHAYQWGGDQHYYINIRGSLTQNNITSTQRIDESLRTVFQPINQGNSYSMSASGSYSNAIIKKVLKYNVNVYASWTQNPSIINDLEVLNTTQWYRLSGGVNSTKGKVVKGHIGFHGNYQYNQVNNNNSLNNAMLTIGCYSDLEFILTERWNIKSNFNANYLDDLGYNAQYFMPMWDIETGYSLLKDKLLKLSFKVHNVLNQQFTVRRNMTGNSLNETRTNLLPRYFMLSVLYKINGMAKGAEDDLIFIQ